MSSLMEVNGDKLSRWFRHGQPLSIPFQAQGKQVTPVSSYVAVACKKHVY